MIDLESIRRWAPLLVARTRLEAPDLQSTLVKSDFVGALLDYRKVHFIQGADGQEHRISSELCLQMVRYLQMIRQQPAWDTTRTAREVWNLLGKGETVEGVEVPVLSGHALQMDRVVTQGIVDEVLEEERVRERTWRSEVYQAQRRAAA
ncbi:hypothetical protein [Corynebacterium terpenotabidum]|uniref:Uncharacterized protein n=1 Tax=Corynebacterium terpenotabidum Y-11 TaxID=1200352 RepID=S4XER3_9CORY|nr:hypothetical protein [Corynebacterium terpenotabidum]AGP30100.1 hypothetical protein A606_02235 [Corynebacterium terpenotabidum Y-11]